MRTLLIWQRSGYLSLDLAAGVGDFFRLKRDLPALHLRAATAASPNSQEGAGPGAYAPLSPQAEANATDLSADDRGAPAGLSALVERIPLQGDGREPLATQLAAFRDAILGVAPPPVSGEDGLRALRLHLPSKNGFGIMSLILIRRQRKRSGSTPARGSRPPPWQFSLGLSSC